VGSTQVRHEAGQSGEQAKVRRHCRRDRIGRGVGVGEFGGAGLQREGVLLPGQPRRAHSIAAQGGINAAKNYQNDGDSVRRLFYDTIKGGDFRAREANVYRLAQVSVNIIDQCVAQGVPFAREYGGCWPTGRSAARKFPALFTRGARPDSNCYWALTRPCAAKSAKEQSKCFRAPKCSTS